MKRALFFTDEQVQILVRGILLDARECANLTSEDIRRKVHRRFLKEAERGLARQVSMVLMDGSEAFRGASDVERSIRLARDGWERVKFAFTHCDLVVNEVQAREKMPVYAMDVENAAMKSIVRDKALHVLYRRKDVEAAIKDVQSFVRSVVREDFADTGMPPLGVMPAPDAALER